MKIKDFLFAVIIIIAISAFNIVRFLTDWIWFSSVGYEPVFLTVLVNSIFIGSGFALAFLIFSMANAGLAVKFTGKKKQGKEVNRIIASLIAVISVVIGIAFSSWNTVLSYLNGSFFGIADPVFGLDVGFYVFTLPLYSMLHSFALATIAITSIITFIVYLLRSKSVKKVEVINENIIGPPRSNVEIKWGKIPRTAYAHMSILIGLILIVISFGFMIAQWNMLFTGGTVYGAGYADISAGIPLMQLLSVIAVLGGLAFFLNAKLLNPKIAMGAVGALIVIGVIGAVVYGATQALIVSPDEFNLEKQYIERNIRFTGNAYGLDEFEVGEFPIAYNLTNDDIKENRATVDNIRLWDWRPLTQTYEQLQLFRTYYNFYDVDVDRYDIGGMPKAVMISARGLNTDNLPGNAKTWVNEHLVYTHGYGIVMNPVSNVTEQGLPEFYIKDIPPKSDTFSVTRPEIYFGEGVSDYSIVKTDTEELDYPSGDKNIYTIYEGDNGIKLSENANRLLFAIRFMSPEMLLSGSISKDSRIMINREIKERAEKIAPFLRYDSDPYIVLSSGKLYWMIDAYTSSDMYPYSEPIWLGRRDRINYIRNTVKVVVDAYSGDIGFFVIDKNDPIIQTYMKIFPGLFRDISEIDDTLYDHIRYPEDLFQIQAEMFSIYHMKDPRVFYNKEDVWVTPNEIYRGGEREIQPYYIITKLPGNDMEEFVMIKPFVPRGKQNLIGWMAARSDAPNYGKVQIYKFSKQELAYGPMQIEARIDQDTDISQKITLWSQSGSNVIRGNTLVIPIKNSLLYIEPLYLEATAKGTLPELKRVIVAYENRISMKPTLEEALMDIFGEGTSSSPDTDGDSPEDDGSGITLTAEEKVSRIAELYRKAQDALRDGKLSDYGKYVEEIGDIAG